MPVAPKTKNANSRYFWQGFSNMFGFKNIVFDVSQIPGGLKGSGRSMGFISTTPGTCPTPWFRVMTIYVKKLTNEKVTSIKF